MDTCIALLALAVAIIALYVTCRFQILTFVNAQLLEVAKISNSYLQEDYQVHKDGKITAGRASGIVTALEDAEKIMKYYYKNHYLLIFKSDEENFRRFFFNHLHSSIKVILKEPMLAYDKPDKYDVIRKDQLDKACKFFEKEIIEIRAFEKNREERLGIKS